MRDFLSFVDTNSVYFVLGLLAVSFLLLIYCVCVSRELARYARRRNAKLTGDSVDDILNAISDHNNTLTSLQGQVDELKSGLSNQAVIVAGCMQRIGIVRFDAFDDVGGEQSFSLVIIDDRKNGLAFSSLYGRQDTRVYAKRIANGSTERPLSGEEQKALDAALASSEVVASARH